MWTALPPAGLRAGAVCGKVLLCGLISIPPWANSALVWFSVSWLAAQSICQGGGQHWPCVPAEGEPLQPGRWRHLCPALCSPCWEDQTLGNVQIGVVAPLPVCVSEKEAEKLNTSPFSKSSFLFVCCGLTALTTAYWNLLFMIMSRCMTRLSDSPLFCIPKR